MRCRILVADDSTPIQKVIKIAFSKYQVEILTAGSLSESLKESERAHPELVIADASLPGVAAASDFSRILAKSQGAAMIMLMGTYDSVRESDLRAAGFEVILKKPFDAIELLEACERMLPGKLSQSGAGSTSTKENAPQSAPPAPHVAPGVPLFSLDAPDPAMTPPPPVVDTTRKGRPAFDERSGDLPSGLPQVPTTPGSMASVADRSAASWRSAPAGLELSMSSDAYAGPQLSFDPPPHAAKNDSSLGKAPSATLGGISGAAEDFMRHELPALVERAVERYCREHFKGVARDILTTELRRLADEKARYLVDQ